MLLFDAYAGLKTITQMKPVSQRVKTDKTERRASDLFRAKRNRIVFADDPAEEQITA